MRSALWAPMVGAEKLFEEAAAEGDPDAARRLVRMHEEAGNHEEAEAASRLNPVLGLVDLLGWPSRGTRGRPTRG